MRVLILGAKGGVGKSVISLLVSISLAKEGKKVLVVDRDINGYISYLAGIRGYGLLSSVIDNVESEYLVDVTLDDFSFSVLKFYGDGVRLFEDVKKLEAHEVRSEISRRYREILGQGFEYVIYDNRGMVFPSDLDMKLEIETYRSLNPMDPSQWIFVSSAIKPDLDVTMDYSKRLWEKWREKLQVLSKYLVINMFSQVENIKIDFNRLEEEYELVTVFPFIEELFQFSGEIKNIPREEHRLTELVKKLI
ncbi:tyrosine-protein kinase family protein [Metallosphaera tengchongensis]|uniref:Tyrosine-protein kinase family protein n=1 Tax=Metallosphaera tengchongensis TaxID=1532350 RepID=A0A6N0NVJ6_9CREN|nr:AAA family ATPase [Metallosphaera tengchongensis]QKR00235.1 tyrosine-protein kinase family protein [Metallosphaera tengchongensis]